MAERERRGAAAYRMQVGLKAGLMALRTLCHRASLRVDSMLGSLLPGPEYSKSIKP